MGSCQAMYQIPQIIEQPKPNENNLKEIILIQAHYRGHLARKQFQNQEIKQTIPHISTLDEHVSEQQPYNTDRSFNIFHHQSELEQLPQEIQQDSTENSRMSKQQFMDGVLEAHWEHGKVNGKGYYKANDGSYYEGEWINNLMEGYGEYYDSISGSKYKGQWSNGRQNGFGTEIFQDQSYYQGNYYNGRKNGVGKLIFSDGSQYNGEFRKDKFNGKGLFIWDNGKKSYEGDWVNGKKNGIGTMRVDDHYIYEGEYVDNLREGNGNIQFADGKEYRGQWRSGYQHGEGVFIDKSGFTRRGIWKYGKYQI